MPTVQFKEADVSVEGDEGKDIRQIANKNKVSVYGGVNKLFNCRGFGLCGSDRIKIEPGDCVTPMTWKESLHLDKKSGTRLACQANLCGDASISVQPAIEYGVEMNENLKVGATALVFGGGTLFFIVFMLFELVGSPLF